jgi:hypothetical protein
MRIEKILENIEAAIAEGKKAAQRKQESDSTARELLVDARKALFQATITWLTPQAREKHISTLNRIDQFLKEYNEPHS